LLGERLTPVDEAALGILVVDAFRKILHQGMQETAFLVQGVEAILAWKLLALFLVFGFRGLLGFNMHLFSCLAARASNIGLASSQKRRIRWIDMVRLRGSIWTMDLAPLATERLCIQRSSMLICRVFKGVVPKIPWTRTRERIVSTPR
jgi:hypothetical protein